MIEYLELEGTCKDHGRVIIGAVHCPFFTIQGISSWNLSVNGKTPGEFVMTGELRHEILRGEVLKRQRALKMSASPLVHVIFSVRVHIGEGEFCEIAEKGIVWWPDCQK